MSAKFTAIPALLAACAMVAAPVEAAALAPAGKAHVAAAGEPLSYHRYYRYRRGPSVGDVLTGVLIIGGIAAVADAATKASRNKRYDDRSNPPYRNDSRYDDGRGIDRAVEMCVDAIERDARVESVDRVERTAAGWRVAGSLYDGKPFSCSLGEDGRIEAIDVDGRARDLGRDEREDRSYGEDRRYDDDRQYDDDRYSREWKDRDAGAMSDRADQSAQSAEVQPNEAQPGEEDMGDLAEAPSGDEPKPEYPGGPLPGEDIAGDISA